MQDAKATFVFQSRSLTRSWLLLASIALAACGSVPSHPPRTLPEPAPDRVYVDETGEQRSARDEWLRQRLREADGTVRDGASTRGARSWETWAASHAPAKPLGKAASPIGARSWQEIGPRNIAGRVLAVAFDPTDPDVLWAGSAGGGLYRSANFGQTWTRIGGDHLPSLWIGAIAIDPKNPKTLYLGTGETNNLAFGHGGFGGLLKTADGGQTFTQLPIPDTAFFRVLVSPTDSSLVLAAGLNGLYRSTDAGAHFTKTLDGKISDFAQDPKNPSRLMAVRALTSTSPPNSGIFESLDEGVTWHPLGETPRFAETGWGRSSIAFPPAPSKAVYLALSLFGGPGGAAFYRSPDDGRTWDLETLGSTPSYRGVSTYGSDLTVAPNDELFLAQADGYDVAISHDGGVLWTRPGGDWHADTHAIAFNPLSPSRMVLATDGGVAVSRDAGATFWKVDLGFPTVQFYTCAIGLWNPVSLFGGTQDKLDDDLPRRPRRRLGLQLHSHPGRYHGHQHPSHPHPGGTDRHGGETGHPAQPRRGARLADLPPGVREGRYLPLADPAGAQPAPPGAGLRGRALFDHLPRRWPELATERGAPLG